MCVRGATVALLNCFFKRAQFGQRILRARSTLIVRCRTYAEHSIDWNVCEHYRIATATVAEGIPLIQRTHFTGTSHKRG